VGVQALAVALEQSVHNCAKATASSPKKVSHALLWLFYTCASAPETRQCVNGLEALGSSGSWQEKGTRRAAQVALVQQSQAQAGTRVQLLKVSSSDRSACACSSRIPAQLLPDVSVPVTQQLAPAPVAPPCSPSEGRRGARGQAGIPSS